jgi:hypothetical protein
MLRTLMLVLLPLALAPADRLHADPAPDCAALPAAGADSARALRFEIEHGGLFNAFFRDGAVAAHLLLRSDAGCGANDAADARSLGRVADRCGAAAGPDRRDREADRTSAGSRLLVAFPAGNSGAGLWFEPSTRPLQWRLRTPLAAAGQCDAQGRALHGIAVEVEVDTDRLVLREALLGNLRTLRDYELHAVRPEQLALAASTSANTVVWARDRIDGAAGYSLAIEVTGGGKVSTAHGRLVLQAAPGRPLQLSLRALTGETPLTPVEADRLLGETRDDDLRSRRVLEFLSYEEKYLAGSWRFNTYFGRDTLMTLRLLMPALQPAAVEAGLGAVLARLSARGEVAHEEDIGEFAILRRRSERIPGSGPLHDYSMIDDDFMLAPVAAAWLLDDPRGRARAAAFLAASAPGRPSNGKALVRNLGWVVERSRPFAEQPAFANLIALAEGRHAGQWRDSDEGLARGRYPYDVNVAFVPAALAAIDALLGSGLLDPYLGERERQPFAAAAQAAAVWNEKAPVLFELELPAESAAAQIRVYAGEIGVPVEPGGDGSRASAFHAIALDADGRPLPVLHSDVGFRWLFGQPSPDELAHSLAAVARRFPAGLLTDAGLLVANPVFAERAVWRRLDASAYHGTVVWSWQQALWAAGLQRQLARNDLPVGLRSELVDLQARLWRVIEATRAERTSELWSWSHGDDGYRVEPFGARGSDEDESNAAQLWSTVFLALSPPGPVDADPVTADLAAAGRTQ